MDEEFEIKHSRFEAESNRYFIDKIIGFIIWPFFTWLLCLRRPNTKSSYIVFFLFSILLCWHMAPTGGDMYDDFLGIMERFLLENFTLGDIKNQISAYISFNDDAPKEIYENLMICIVKSFTDNYHFYFLICSIPVAYCQLKSLFKITSDIKFQKGTMLSLFVLILFIFPRDIITVQNPRYTTGFWICILCTLNYFGDSKKDLLCLLPILFTPLVHSGMWLYLIFTLLFLFVPNYYRLFELFALVSIPFTFLDSEIIQGLDLSSILPPFLYNWSLNHFNPEEIVSQVGARAGFWWVGASFALVRKIVYIYIALVFIKYRDSILTNSESCKLYPFFLCLFGVVNIVQCIPVLGERYFWFIQVFTIYIWFKAFYPRRSIDIILLIVSSSWALFFRYGYLLGGALSATTPIDIFYTPLPYLIGKGIFW